MNIIIKFRNREQEQFFYHKERDGHFGGGFGNGKTYVAMQRAFVHLATFSEYAMAIARLKYKVLKATTMKTFWKICPKEMVLTHNEQDGYTVLINKSFIYWMHLDAVDEDDVKGLEVNSEAVDQAEEIPEGIVDIFNARVGRWDQAKVPNYLLIEKVKDEEVKAYIQAMMNEDSFKKADLISSELFKYSQWPKDPFGERFTVPNYFDCLSNPPDEGEMHWTYRWFYPESKDRIPNSFHIVRGTQDELNDSGTIRRVLNKDQEFIDKYYHGKIGSPRAIIHRVTDQSIIRPAAVPDFNDFIKKLLAKGALYRLLDHGESGVTTCGWLATLNNCHIFYREYYVHGGFVSDHRREISNLSLEGKAKYNVLEKYEGDFADPAIFKETNQRAGKRYSISDEYWDELEVDGPPLFWQEADNNEYATRNRINELLLPSEKYTHPITGESPAPGLYFIEADADIYPNGIVNGILQTKAQKRTLVGSLNGKNIYIEERDESVVDHGYDYVRYGVAAHNTNKAEERKRPSKRSFAYFNALLKMNPEFVPNSGYTPSRLKH